jgi:hypothetical protein
MADALIPERSAEPIAGWRVWDLSDDPTYGPLLHPVASDGAPWWPRRAVEARCEVPPILTPVRRRHSAPNPDCNCGIHASRSLETLERPRPAWPPPTVAGTVSLWGRVVEHELGWRAAFAYPARLRLVCPMCAWFEPGPGTPVVVHRFARRLYALCAEHRGGIQVPDGRRSVPVDAQPGALQGRLLAAYAVELLPLEHVEPLFRFPRTPEPPPYMPTIRVVPIADGGSGRTAEGTA